MARGLLLITKLVWWGGTLFTAVVGFSAVEVLLNPGSGMWRGIPYKPGLGDLAIVGLLAALGLAGLLVVVVVARRGRAAIALGIGFAVLIATRVAAIAIIPTPLNTDWGDYQHQAIQLAATGIYNSPRPPGFPIALSLLYRIGGPNPLFGELLNLACAVVVGILVVILGKRWLGDVAAAVGLYAWAISPGPVLFTAVLASENLYTPFFIGALVLASLAVEGQFALWAGAAALLGVSQYVRPASLVLVPALVLFVLLTGLPRRRAALAILVLTFTFLVVLSPGIVWQYQRFGWLTLSTSNYDGLNLLVGLNLKSDGQYNRGDLALAGSASNSREFHDRTYRLAIQRLLSEKSAIPALAIRKIPILWGDSTYGAKWAINANPVHDLRAGTIMALLSQLAYAAATLAAAAFLFVRRRERDMVSLLFICCLGAVAASEVFLEVQSRYHAPLEPLFYLLAGGFVAWLAGARTVQVPAPSSLTASASSNLPS